MPRNRPQHGTVGKMKRNAGIIYKNAPEHPYKKYESHRFWKKLKKGISDLVENQDLVEREARSYIVGYLCKILLKPKKKRKRRSKA
jgi:hypothetical protein